MAMNADGWRDEVDPRIKAELERLNNASHQINLLEKDHENAQGIFRRTLVESASHLKLLYDKLGKKVDQARPYYEALHQTNHVHNESGQAASRYDRACDNYHAAKDMIKKAEDKLNQDQRFLDSACQEMLNHATIKVMKANQDRIVAEREHLEVSLAFNEMQEKTTHLQKNLKSVIHKTRSYFELKEKYNKMLEGQKRKIFKLHNDILDAKQKYHTALRNLEEISDSIHERRGYEMSLLEPRGQGVGEESTSKDCLIETERSGGLSISLEVEKDMDSAIKALTLQDSKSELNDNASFDEDQKSFGEASLCLTDSDDSGKCNSLLETPPFIRKTSKEMKGKLFVSPPIAQSEDNLENTSIRLEKWFFFNPVVEDTASTIVMNKS